MPQFARDTDVIDRLKDDVTTFAHLCHARGLVSGTGGNVSARLPGQHTFWIMATGVPLRRAAPSDCVEVDALRQHPEAVALLLREHGIVAIGESVEHAYHLAELLEETAQTAIGAQVVAQMLEARDA